MHSTPHWTPEGAFILYIYTQLYYYYYPDPSPFLSASTNEGPCASFSNTARMPLIFLMGIYVKKKIYGPPRTRRRRKNKDLFLVVVLVIEMWPLLYCFIYCHSQWSWQTQVDELDFDNRALVRGCYIIRHDILPVSPKSNFWAFTSLTKNSKKDLYIVSAYNDFKNLNGAPVW